MTDLEKSIRELPELLKALKDKFKFSDEKKFSEVKAGEKTFKYSPEGELATGVEIFEGDNPCPDGDYENDTVKFSVKGGKVIDFSKKEAPAPAPDLSAEMKSQKEAFEKQAADNKAYFEAEIKIVKDAYTSEITGIKAKAESQEKILKDMFSLVEKIAELPSEDSKMKKKDGAKPQTKTLSDYQEEVKKFSQTVFK